METQEAAKEAVVFVVNIMILVVGVSMGIIASYSLSGALGKGIKAGVGKLQQAAGKAAKGGANMAGKAAKNTKYGQAAQQFMKNRKAISSLKGSESLREALNKRPELVKLMGGAGGQAHAERFLDTENRKERAQKVAELSDGMTLPVGNAVAEKYDLTESRRRGQWVNRDGSVATDGNGVALKGLSDEDKVSVDKLHKQGYVGNDGQIVRSTQDSAIAANAALESIFKADDANAQKVNNIAELLKDTSAQANADFSSRLRELALKGKNKDIAFGQVNDGKYEQFVGKTRQGVLKSGLGGINGDALKESNVAADGSENALLRTLREETVDPSGDRNVQAIIERTRQTLDQNNQEVIASLAKAMAFHKTDSAGNKILDSHGQPEIDVQAFKDLRAAMVSGGGLEALPEPYRTAAGYTPPPTPTAGP